MSDDQNPYQFSLKNEAATVMLAAKLAGITVPGDVIALIGDLGAGKTAFARGFIAACGGDGEVPSPTFTLVQLYEFPAGDVYHFDLYRIENSEEIFELGIEDAMSDGISLIEWPDRMGAYLPFERLDIVLSTGKDENGREVDLIGRGDGWTQRLEKAFPQ
jgi:tRNA threonylcarbamoyl adenosine modification protein YjeE